jgi:anaerobic glycerol-3-phosphate dehydrogenase
MLSFATARVKTVGRAYSGAAHRSHNGDRGPLPSLRPPFPAAGPPTYLARMDQVDVLVVGGGAAGVAAALAAVGAGARTALVRAAPGATALGGGGWHGAPPRAFADALADAGLTLEATIAPLPHPDGRLLHFDAAAVTHAGAGIDATSPVTLVCGIDGLPHFRPDALARLWSDAAQLPAGSLRAASVTVRDTPAAGWSPVSLAAMLERDPALLGEPLAQAAAAAGAACVIVPAVLGFDGAAGVTAAIGRTAGLPVAESLGTPPSLPGWRLDQALLRVLESAGVVLVRGTVTGHGVNGSAVSSVEVREAAAPAETGAQRRRSIGCRAVVLAGGKYLGGGIATDPVLADSVLGMDVAVQRLGRLFRDASDSLALTDPLRTQSQPILGAGIATNEAGNPVAASGDVIFHNVFAAGTVRADTVTSSYGLGHSASDGWTMGERAAQAAVGGRAPAGHAASAGEK